METLDGLEQVDWGKLQHAYGTAKDVPDMLLRLTSKDENEVQRAWTDLLQSVHHQGDIYDSTSVVISFLLKLLNASDILLQHHVFYFLESCVRIASKANYMIRFENKLKVLNVALKGFHQYLKFLDHSDRQMRYGSIFLLQRFVGRHEKIFIRLKPSVDGETDEDVKAYKIHLFGQCIEHAVVFDSQNMASQQDYLKPYLESESLKIQIAAASALIASLPINYHFENRQNTSLEQLIYEKLIHTLANLPVKDNYPLIYREEDPTYYVTRSLVFLLTERLSKKGGIEIFVNLFKQDFLTEHELHEVAFRMCHLVFEKLDDLKPDYSDDEYYWMFRFESKEQTEDHMYSIPNHHRIGCHPVYPVLWLPSTHRGRAQILVLKALVENERFWQNPTNLFSFFYGLPNEREALRQLVKDNEGN